MQALAGVFDLPVFDKLFDRRANRFDRSAGRFHDLRDRPFGAFWACPEGIC